MIGYKTVVLFESISISKIHHDQDKKPFYLDILTTKLLKLGQYVSLLYGHFIRQLLNFY